MHACVYNETRRVLPEGEEGRRRSRVESARRRVECRPKSVLMPKVLTSLSDRGRCNRNNNSNSNNHATAPRRYQLIALLGIKAALVCAPRRARFSSEEKGPPRLSNSYFAEPIRTTSGGCKSILRDINVTLLLPYHYICARGRYIVVQVSFNTSRASIFYFLRKFSNTRTTRYARTLISTSIHAT